MHYNTNLKSKSDIEERFTSLDIQYDEEHELAWYYECPAKTMPDTNTYK
jgi:hypothetical protein